MRLIFGLVLILGLGLAGAAVYMTNDFIARTQAEAEALRAEQARAVRLVDVVVVTKALKYGDRFTQTDLEVIKVQESKVPEGTFAVVSAPIGAMQEDGTTPVASAFLDGETRPRAALRSYEPFEPLLAKKVTEPGVDAGINANLTAGMRAFAINVDVSSGVSGFLRPGDRVDIYWSGAAGGKDVTKLIQEGVRLIAIDQSADADRSEETLIARTVTVETSPQNVAALAQAQQTGRLTLSLVGQGDQTTAGAVEIDQNTLLGITEEEVIQAEPERVCTVRQNKGGEIVEVPIECQDE
jgi:pilus assembly protein CpaB